MLVHQNLMRLRVLDQKLKVRSKLRRREKVKEKKARRVKREPKVWNHHLMIMKALRATKKM
jgi:hypothetical protein